MVEFKDRGDVERWLLARPLERAKADAMALAARAALRVVPTLAEDFRNHDAFSAAVVLEYFRCLSNPIAAIFYSNKVPALKEMLPFFEELREFIASNSGFSEADVYFPRADAAVNAAALSAAAVVFEDGRSAISFSADASAFSASADAAFSKNNVVGLFTPREREVLRLVDQHLSSKEIARRLGISKHTVDSHLDRAREKLGVSTRYDAARILASYDRGLPTLPQLDTGRTTYIAIAEDADLLNNLSVPSQLLLRPLWPSGKPGWVDIAWLKLQNYLLLRNENWDVWTDWWEDRLNGRPPRNSPDVEIARATLDQSFWDQGPKAVNAELKRLIAEDDEIRRQIPGQVSAPVRVEIRNGQIARMSDRDSPLLSAEKDFNQWREPVADHIAETLSGDFAHGTNHGRARERLLALANLLSGSVADVKENQFRLGYEIERFNGLLAAYREGGEDMPSLSADVLNDMSLLGANLIMGVGKLERWAEFNAPADKEEGDVDRGVVIEVIEEAEITMIAEPKYFHPELPATFRFLIEAVKDPVGATKTVIYGAVESVQNLVSFLLQQALRTGKTAVEAVDQHIGKAVAAGLVAAIAEAALKLSNALPTAWTWLKPALEVILKMKI